MHECENLTKIHELSVCENKIMKTVKILNLHLLKIGMYCRHGKFAGLNFHDFNCTEVFAETLSCFLSQKCLLLKSDTYIHGKTSVVLLNTAKP